MDHMMNDLKSEFGLAFVRAVAHASGYFVQETSRTFDGDGVDLTIMWRDDEGMVRSPRLDVQLKTTSLIDAARPIFDLDVKTYNALRSCLHQVPRILLAVAVPHQMQDWVTISQDELILRYRGYWHSCRGEAASQNTTSVRVRLSDEQLFQVTTLQAIMERIREGGLP